MRYSRLIHLFNSISVTSSEVSVQSAAVQYRLSQLSVPNHGEHTSSQETNTDFYRSRQPTAGLLEPVARFKKHMLHHSAPPKGMSFPSCATKRSEPANFGHCLILGTIPYIVIQPAVPRMNMAVNCWGGVSHISSLQVLPTSKPTQDRI